jgi:hypothetical protein
MVLKIYEPSFAPQTPSVISSKRHAMPESLIICHYLTNMPCIAKTSNMTRGTLSQIDPEPAQIARLRLPRPLDAPQDIGDS